MLLSFNRWDTSIDESVYNDPTKMGRTLASVGACANKPSNAPASDRLGVKNQPLLDIEPSQIIPDELHLLLRIGDVLVSCSMRYYLQNLGSKESRWKRKWKVRLHLSYGNRYEEDAEVAPRFIRRTSAS